MSFTIPFEAQFLTVEFATPDGGTHKQRVVPHHPNQASVIAAAVKGCKRRKVAVANVLRITHGKAVLFDAIDAAGNTR